MKVRIDNLTVEGIPVEIQRKRIRNLHLRVLPPNGQVRVSGPMRASDRTFRNLVTGKLDWIRHHQERIRNLPRPAPREMTTGEIHPFLGEPHRLEVIEESKPARVEREMPETLLLHAPRNSSVKKRRELLDKWYRSELENRIPPLLEKWQAAMNVRVTGWRTRKMKTRWGSCNTKTRRIQFNLELVKEPPRCIEYVVVHELAHLLERGHGARFRKIMTRFLPEWPERKKELDALSPHVN